MKRTIEKYLIEWKNSKDRKVLLVRGARQVGKTFSIRKLGRSFDNLLEVNFEEEPDVKSFFDGSLNPIGIVEKLQAYFGSDIIPGKTLLFFDEIQACPNALKSLRFFYEKLPEQHVIAAGSLLEFAISEIPSFGVGRITSLFLYPMSFSEFVQAVESCQLSAQLEKAVYEKLNQAFHKKFIELYRLYSITGGMPAVVSKYVSSKKIEACQQVLDELIVAFIDDFAKYAKESQLPVMQEVFYSIVNQTGGKFKYTNVSKEYRSESIKNALEILVKAGLAHKVFHTSAQGLPLGAQINPKRFKVLLWDIGIYHRLLKLDLKEYLVADDAELINKGNAAELFAGLEIIADSSPFAKEQLYYWHRESKSSNAEVDYVIQSGNDIVPLEVKAGTKGRYKSMNIFLEERNLSKGICLTAGEPQTHNNIQHLPIYVAGKL